MSVTCRGVQIICRYRTGLKTVLILVETLLTFQTPQLRSHLIHEEQTVSLQGTIKKEMPHFHFASASGRRCKVPFRLCLIYYYKGTLKYPFHSFLFKLSK